MLVVSRFVVPREGAADLQESARAALRALASRPGFLRGRLGRATDEPSAWLLLTEWDGVGAYRRALSAYDVRVEAAPLLALAEPEAGAFEVLLEAEGAAEPVARPSGRAADADRVRVGEASQPRVPTEGYPDGGTAGYPDGGTAGDLDGGTAG